jgi:hypothetical protein
MVSPLFGVVFAVHEVEVVQVQNVAVVAKQITPY